MNEIKMNVTNTVQRVDEKMRKLLDFEPYISKKVKLTITIF